MSSNSVVLAGLRTQLLEVAQKCFTTEQRYVLLDHPTHSNIGDHAIWLGERQLLADVGLRATYTSNAKSVDWDRLQATSTSIPIIIHGGGNLGDLWPRQQAFREEVIARFPNRKIVQMPQTVWFESRVSLERARRCFESHPDLTILARDERSHGFLTKNFEVRVLLSPDAAMWLHLDRVREPITDVHALLRSDQESKSAKPVLQSIAQTDWLLRVGPRGFNWPRLFHRVESSFPTKRLAHTLNPLQSAAADRSSRHHVRRGVGLLSQGRVVITDRLHGHIFCLLLGIPHVALDNSYGKVHGFIDTWTRESPLVSKATSVEQAVEMADLLVKELSEA